MYVGIIRPISGWDRKALKKFSPFAPKHRRKLLREKTDQWGSCSVHCCAIRVGRGNKFTTSWSDSEGPQIGLGWPGMNNFETGETTTFGMLLDSDEGTLAMYQNGRNLGMINSGLTGSYCWMVNLWGICGQTPQEVTMQMETPPAEV